MQFKTMLFKGQRYLHVSTLKLYINGFPLGIIHETVSYCSVIKELKKKRSIRMWIYHVTKVYFFTCQFLETT